MIAAAHPRTAGYIATMLVEPCGAPGGDRAATTTAPVTRRGSGGMLLPLEVIFGVLAFVGLFAMWAVIPARIKKH